MQSLYGDRLCSVLLYGSVARGEATADSDIDGLVVLKEQVLPVQEIRRMADIRYIPLKITSLDGDDFVVVSAEDWEQQQETLFVLQNSNLMQQISRFMATHIQNQGYHPSKEELNEILSL